jgi:hypothetical protein
MGQINLNRSEHTGMIPAEAIMYLPVPVENPAPGAPAFEDRWAKFSTLKQALQFAYNYITATESPFAASTLQQHVINTADGVVEFVLPETPEADDRFLLVPALPSYETNALIIRHNGVPIAGVLDDVTVNINGMAVELLYLNGTIGWVVLEKGQTAYIQRSVVYGSDVTNRRITAQQNVITGIDDLETLIITTSDVNGTIQLPDSTTVADIFQFSVLQVGDGQMTFIIDPASADVITEVNDATTTLGPGSLIQVVKAASGSWVIAGALN